MSQFGELKIFFSIPAQPPEGKKVLEMRIFRGAVRPDLVELDRVDTGSHRPITGRDAGVNLST